MHLVMAHYQCRYFILSLFVTNVFAELTIYQYPGEILPSDKFRVYVQQDQSRHQCFTYINRADHRAAELSRKGKDYIHRNRSVSWSSFAFIGNPVTVEIQTQKDFHKCIIRPSHYGYNCEKTGPKTAQFTVTSNTRMMSVEFDFDYGSMNRDIADKLLIFADSPETTVPQPNASGVLYYPAGVTDLGGQLQLNARIREVYLAPGAYVHGGFITTSRQPVKIYGRGILSGEKYKFRTRQFKFAVIQMDTGSNHTIEGLTILDPPRFFIRAKGNYNIVGKVKTVGAWTYNTDGVVVGKYGMVTDSFFMVNDDAIKIYYNNIIVQNCVVWQSQNGAVFQTGWGKTRYIQHVRVSDIDVIHADWCAFKPRNCRHLSQNNAVLAISDSGANLQHIEASDVEFRNIRIEGRVQRLFNFIVRKGSTGNVSTFSFVNWTVEQVPYTSFHSQINGTRMVNINNWRFENFKIEGKCISKANEANLRLDPSTVVMTTFHCPATSVVR